MADYENSIFGNLPQRRRGAGVLDDERPSWREVLSMRNFDEGPLPPRPHVSGKGGPSINQGSKPPVATSVWSASDAAANGMTLSNGGLTVTAPATVGYRTIRGTTSKTSGKLYIEFNVGVANGNGIEGVANSTFISTNAGLGSSNYSAGVEYGATPVSIGFTANYSGTASYPVTGDTWAIAIDFAAGSIWEAKNNVWINGSNPATGSLPVISFVPATVGALFPAITTHDAGEVWTLQPTPASQKYLPPPGFQAWDGGPVTPPPTSVWSASDAAAAAGMTLSNGGLTISGTLASGYASVRNSASHSSGKVYIEILTSVALASQVLQVGVASAGFVALNQYLGTSNYSAGYNLCFGSIAGSGITGAGGPSLAISAGDVIAIAIDFSAGNVWVAQNNSWLSSGNPATGASPFMTFTPATVGALFAAIALASVANAGPPNYSLTLQPTAASQKYAPPSGFSPWG